MYIYIYIYTAEALIEIARAEDEERPVAPALPRQKLREKVGVHHARAGLRARRRRDDNDSRDV